MNNSTVLNQILSFIPQNNISKVVNKHNGDRYVKTFNCRQQFITNMYAQISGKNSLRDIVTGLKVHCSKWYHLGIGNVSKSNLAHANRNRSYQIYEDLFYKQLTRCQAHTPKHKFKFDNPLYAMDSTTIDLCLSVFPWAKFRKKKGAIKLHCILDQRGEIPSFVAVSDGKRHDVTAAKNMGFKFSRDSILAVDKAYIDFEWLYQLDSNGVFFITRSKRNMKYRVLGQHDIPETKRHYILADETIELVGFNTNKKYPSKLRLITFYDHEKDKEYKFITNNFKLAASTIAEIYKSRWTIELFFKWIKQNLKIKTFIGTSKNAVLTQIWTAMIYFLLLAYIKYQTKYSGSFLELSRVVKNALFEQSPLIDFLSLKWYHSSKDNADLAQLNLF